MTEQERLDKGIYSIPGSLIEAVDKFSNSDLMKATLGEHLFREYIKAKTQEWDKFRTAVTNWEIKDEDDYCIFSYCFHSFLIKS